MRIALVAESVFDADHAACSQLARKRRALTTVATTDAAYRADLVTRYATAHDWAEELALLAEAADYDRANPGAPSLTDELYGASLGDVA